MRELEQKITVAPGNGVSSVWRVPDAYLAGQGSAIILAHGAGNDMHHPFLSAMHRAFAEGGALSVKFNFPYKERGAKAPDRLPTLEASWRAMVGAVRTSAFAPRRLFLSGKSMGGRIASHLAAAGDVCDGLIFFGYPLHPPRRPDKLRSAHLARIRCPMLFIQGTRDPLCDVGLLESALASVTAPVALHRIEGGDHSFKLSKRQGRTEADVWNEMAAVARAWMEKPL